MLEGTVRWFNDSRGYGFIEADGIDYFAHFKEINGQGFKRLKEGQKVSFAPELTSKGKCARNISVIA
jgi:CspA family cold shock protein